MPAARKGLALSGRHTMILGTEYLALVTATIMPSNKMELTTLHLAHLPPSLAVYVALYKDVTNALFLRQQLLEGNHDYEYALVDANTIISTTHILAAVFRAVHDFENNRLKSRNVHSEIVFALSPNNNIAESFRRFGVADTTTNLLVVKVSTSPAVTQESVQRHLENAISGTPVAFENSSISSMTDLARVRKIYKLKIPPQKGHARASNHQPVNGDESEELQVVVLGLMALRGTS